MKQFPFCIKKQEDLDHCLDVFLQKCPKTYSSVFVTVFTSHADPLVIREIVEKIAVKVPEAVIIGNCTTAEIYNGKLALKQTVVNFQVYEKSRVTAYAYDFAVLPLLESGHLCAQSCQKLKDLAGLCILGTLKSYNAKPFLDEISQIKPDLPVFGGGADAADKNAQTYVFAGDKILSHGIVVAAFAGADLHIQLSTYFGWRPLGMPMVITAMDGPTVIKELDYQPAITMYEKYLNIKRDDSFFRDTVEFPVFVERNGRSIARRAAGFRDDGALVFAVDFDLGERIRLSYGDPTEIMVSSRIRQREIACFQPQGILIFSCISRRVFLQEDVKLELEPYEKIAPTAGTYSFGEIASFDGKAQVLNLLFIAVGIREGDVPEKNAEVCKLDYPKLDFRGSMSLIQRLARFVNVVTTELEEANRKKEEVNRKLGEANRKLRDLARHDRLTELLNRGEIVAIFHREVERMYSDDFPISAIMIDLDDFKHINDNFGHNMGDEVLRTVAKIMLENIRIGDYAGRFGGEEFLIILPGAPLRIAEIVAERIRAKIESVLILPGGKHVSGSFGVCEVKVGEKSEVFYKRIDNALYQAKHKGKNCVVAG